MQQEKLQLEYYRQDLLTDILEEAIPTFDPQSIIKKCYQLLSMNHLSMVEKYSITEQLVEQLLNIGNLKEANRVINESFTDTLFLDSNRLQILRAMLMESNLNINDACQIYSEIYMKSCSNKASKRLIMCMIGQQKPLVAIELLIQHCDVFMQDTEAFLLLVELYLELGFYKQAEYCVEQVLISRPNDHLIMLKYADLLYSSGDLKMALKYYLGSLEQCSSLYAWIGVKTITNNDDQDKVLNEIATREISRAYSGTRMQELVQNWIIL